MHEFLDEETRTEATLKYIDIYKKGLVAKKNICHYRDYMLTTNHPDPTVDYNGNERDPSTNFYSAQINIYVNQKIISVYACIVHNVCPTIFSVLQRSSTLFRGDIIEEIEWPISEQLQYDANQISVARSKI